MLPEDGVASNICTSKKKDCAGKMCKERETTNPPPLKTVKMEVSSGAEDPSTFAGIIFRKTAGFFCYDLLWRQRFCNYKSFWEVARKTSRLKIQVQSKPNTSQS